MSGIYIRGAVGGSTGGGGTPVLPAPDANTLLCYNFQDAAHADPALQQFVNTGATAPATPSDDGAPSSTEGADLQPLGSNRKPYSLDDVAGVTVSCNFTGVFQ